ncbi:MAG: hypothetical protein JRJ85_26925 [Deltaproteobacteria bacterium]|nr:hypothetical protein [Deltaproteobacteria bacterium]
MPAKGPELYKKYETGGLRPDGKPGFDTPSGKVEAVSMILEKHGYPGLCEYKEPIEATPEFPLMLISGNRVPYIAHSKWREDSPWLFELQEDPILTIHPEDAANAGVREGVDAILKTAYGQIRVKAKPTILVPVGMVGIMHGWAKANVNDLIPREFDPISGFPAYKEVICRVERA